MGLQVQVLAPHEAQQQAAEQGDRGDPAPAAGAAVSTKGRRCGLHCHCAQSSQHPRVQEPCQWSTGPQRQAAPRDCWLAPCAGREDLVLALGVVLAPHSGAGHSIGVSHDKAAAEHARQARKRLLICRQLSGLGGKGLCALRSMLQEDSGTFWLSVSPSRPREGSYKRARQPQVSMRAELAPFSRPACLCRRPQPGTLSQQQSREVTSAATATAADAGQLISQLRRQAGPKNGLDRCPATLVSCWRGGQTKQHTG